MAGLKLSITLPESALEAESVSALEERLKLLWALDEVRAGRMTRVRAAQLLGIGLDDLLARADAHDLPAFDDDPTDFRAELASLSSSSSTTRLPCSSWHASGSRHYPRSQMHPIGSAGGRHRAASSSPTAALSRVTWLRFHALFRSVLTHPSLTSSRSALVEGINHFFSDRRGHPLETVKSARERPRGADGEDVDRP
jgi:hypothetical protein